MNKIYDNGEKLLGEVKTIKKLTQERLNNALWDDDKDFYKEVLEELKYYQDTDIIMINYDCGMGWTTCVWEEKDIVKED